MKPSREVPTILFIEDEKDIRQVVKQVLETYGYHVVAAEDEQDAVARALYERPDLILAESGMPTPETMSAARRVRAEAELERNVPVVIYANQPDDFVVEGSEVALKHNEYVTLPENFEQLEHLIDRLLLESTSVA